MFYSASYHEPFLMSTKIIQQSNNVTNTLYSIIVGITVYLSIFAILVPFSTFITFLTDKFLEVVWTEWETCVYFRLLGGKTNNPAAWLVLHSCPPAVSWEGPVLTLVTTPAFVILSCFHQLDTENFIPLIMFLFDDECSGHFATDLFTLRTAPLQILV